MARYGLDLGRKNKSKKKRTVTVVIAFLCFAIVLGSASTLLLWRSLNYDFNNIFKKTDESSTAVPTTVAPTQKSYSGNYSFLVAVTSDDTKELRFINVIAVNLDNKTIRVIPIDGTLNVPGESKVTLGKLLLTKGAAELKAAVEKMYSVTLNRYVTFTDSGYKSVFRTLGNINITVKSDVEYDTDDMFLELKKGENKLTPEKSYKYMRYICAENKGYDAAKLNADVVVAAFTAFYTAENNAESDALFSKLVNYCQTDITIVDFTNAAEELESLVPRSSKDKLKVYVSKNIEESLDEEQ